MYKWTVPALFGLMLVEGSRNYSTITDLLFKSGAAKYLVFS